MKKVVIDEKSINSVFQKDCLLIAAFIILMWATLITVLFYSFNTNTGSIR